MDGKNMAGLTTQEALARVDKQASGCVVTAAACLTLLAGVSGWLVYLACCRWTWLAAALEPAGKAALELAAMATAASAVAGSIEIREG